MQGLLVSFCRVLKSIDSDGTISKKKERYTMVKPIMKDIFFLGQKSEEATRTDRI